jgi:acyl carrier protein
MTEQEAIAHIKRIFEETFSISAPAVQTDIIETGLLDSLALVTLLFEIELQMGKQLPLESLQIHDFCTIESIARLVG